MKSLAFTFAALLALGTVANATTEAPKEEIVIAAEKTVEGQPSADQASATTGTTQDESTKK